MVICGIYCLTSPSGKSYVGQSIDIEKRINQYKKLRCKNQPKIYQAIKKYGFDNMKITILEECDKINLNDSEIFWINYLNTFDLGYNCMHGGNVGILCNESKNKISHSKKGKKMSVEHKINWSKNHKSIKKRISNIYWGIKKRKSVFVVDFTENGKEIFKSGFKTKNEAMVWRNEYFGEN